MNKRSLWRIYRAHLFIKSIYIYKTLHVKITQKHQKQLFLSYKSLFIRQRFSATYNTEYFRVFTLWIPPRHKERKNKQTKNQAPAGYSQTIVVGLSKKSRKGDHNLYIFFKSTNCISNFF